MFTTVISILRGNIYWMSWNLYLAFVPLALSVILFRTRQPHSWVWWILLLIFFAFLPNAPYLLTDIIHAIDLSRMSQSIWLTLCLIMPVYLLIIFIGFESYVLSVTNLGNYLKRRGWESWVIAAELLTHGLCAIGIYLGRFLRFNSWDLITHPDHLLISISKVLANTEQLLITAVAFVGLSGLYWIIKQVNLRFFSKVIRFVNLKIDAILS